MEMQTSPAPQAPLSLGKTILNLSFQAALTLATQNSLSSGQAQEQPPLLPLKIANVSFVIAFAASFTGIFLQHASPRAAKIVEIIGSFVTAMGFFVMTSLFLSGNGCDMITLPVLCLKSDLLHSQSQARMKEEGHVTQIPLELNYRSEFGSSSLLNAMRVYAFALPINTFDISRRTLNSYAVVPTGTLAILILQATRVYAFALPINTFDISRRTLNSYAVVPTGTLAILILQAKRVYAFALPINTFDISRRTLNSYAVVPTGTLAILILAREFTHLHFPSTHSIVPEGHPIPAKSFLLEHWFF
ncbi:unnamed protein product [Prunus armeniaca]|uniref:Uncharacterized protein n=1 Tax=Prunus armeniaca TaxID=36596 RepID=A0A6J5TQX4_PRUAR|nr:unnamed protein product [Prunus armeniaca]